MQFNKHSEFNLGIQQLRGLAAIAVVMCHYASDIRDYPLLSKLFNKGQIGVHIFFLISGYIILHALLKNNYHPRDFFAFLFKRMIRIDPPYICVIILTLLTFWLLTFVPSYGGKEIPFVLGQFLSHLFYIIPFTKWEFYNHIFWTLGVEFQFYILVGALYFINDSTLYRSLFLLLFSLSCFINFKNSYYLVTGYAPIFAMGMAQIHYEKTKKNLYLLLVLTSLLIISWKFDGLITTILIISALTINYCKQSLILFSFLGKISYSLYLIHPLVLIFVLGIGKKYFGTSQNDLLFLLVKLLILIPVTYIFYTLIEKRSIKLAKRFRYNTDETS